MKKKKFATNINLSELAEELGISTMTLYRVMNNEPAVRPSTKKRVIEALNKRGYNAIRGRPDAGSCSISATTTICSISAHS